MDRIENHIEISEQLKRLIPIIGKNKAAKLETAYLLGDENYRKRILEIIDGLRATVFSDTELKESVLIEPPARQISENGDFFIGNILYGKKRLYPLRMQVNDLLTHIGIFGSSGCGKTNIIHNLVRELNSIDVPVVIFDFSKRNYRDLFTIKELKDKVKVYTIGRNVVPFRFNPLKPPENVQISQWAKEFAEVFDHAYWLMGGGRHIILKALDELYKKYSPGYPRIQDLKGWLERYAHVVSSVRERNWVATASRPLESLCFRETGEMFDVDTGINPIQLFEKGKIVVLELDALSNDDKTFLIEIILQWIRDWLIANNIRERLVGVIVLEEAHHVLNREKTKKFGLETVTDLIFREIRELGIGMVYVDQHPSLVSYPALGNTNTHIYMNLGLDTKQSSDIVDAGNMLGLRDELEKDYLRRLSIGHAFILIRKSIFPNPFLIEFPKSEIERGKITDDMLREQMGSIMMKELGDRAVGVIDSRYKVSNELKEKILKDSLKFAKFVQKKEDIEKRMNRVNSNGWKIIELLADSKAVATSDIYKSLKMSCNVFNKHAKELIELGFVNSRRAKVYRQHSVFYFLTHEGELIYALRKGKLPENGEYKFSDKELKFLIEYFALNGWSVKDENGSIVIDRSGKRFVVNISTTKNSTKLYEDFERSAMDGEMYFIAGSEDIKKSVIQQAARFSFNHRNMNFVLYIAGLDEFKKGEKLKKIEFDAI